MRDKLLSIIFGVVSCSVGAVSASPEIPNECKIIQDLSESDIQSMTFTELRKLKSACLAADLRNSMTNIWDGMVEEDPTDEGCLDRLQQIDTSILTFDPNSLLEGVYTSILDQVSNFSCDAITDRINAETGGISIGASLPGGIGSISIKPGAIVDNAEETINVNVEMSNKQVISDISKGIWGDTPPPVQSNKNFNYQRIDGLLEPLKDSKKIKSVEAINKTRLNLKDFGFLKKEEIVSGDGESNE